MRATTPSHKIDDNIFRRPSLVSGPIVSLSPVFDEAIGCQLWIQPNFYPIATCADVAMYIRNLVLFSSHKRRLTKATSFSRYLSDIRRSSRFSLASEIHQRRYTHSLSHPPLDRLRIRHQTITATPTRLMTLRANHRVGAGKLCLYDACN